MYQRLHFSDLNWSWICDVLHLPAWIRRTYVDISIRMFKSWNHSNSRYIITFLGCSRLGTLSISIRPRFKSLSTWQKEYIEIVSWNIRNWRLLKAGGTLQRWENRSSLPSSTQVPSPRRSSTLLPTQSNSSSSINAYLVLHLVLHCSTTGIRGWSLRWTNMCSIGD